MVSTRGGRPFYLAVFTEAERLACGMDAPLLARCFAAKEAVAKAIGTLLAPAVAPVSLCPDVEIRDRRDCAVVSVTLRGELQLRARRSGLIAIEAALAEHLECVFASAAAATAREDVPMMREAVERSLDEFIAACRRRATRLERRSAA